MLTLHNQLLPLLMTTIATTTTTLSSTQSSCHALASTPQRRVLVTGAGGQTGQHIFRKLLTKPGYLPIGTVRSEASRQALLLNGDDDPSSSSSSFAAVAIPPETVAICDITNDDNEESTAKLNELVEGCDAIMICTSAKPAPTGEINQETKRPKFGFPNGQPELVDWIGQKRLIDAAKQSGKDVHVVLCSSMGGTNPDNSLNALGKVTNSDGSTTGGDILKWKRKSEVYLKESGLSYTIVHPGGLLNEPGNQRELCLGVDDKILATSNNSVPREDVANVMIAALEHDEYKGRSFDLVSKPPGDGEVTEDFVQLIGGLEGKNCDYSLGEIA